MYTIYDNGERREKFKAEVEQKPNVDLENGSSYEDKDVKSEEGTLSEGEMVQNVLKTKVEIRQKKFLKAKSQLSLSKFRKHSNKFTIDLN